MTEELRLLLDHISLSVADLTAARPFYQALLAPLGVEIVADLPAEIAGVACTGFGIGRKGSLWLAESGPQTPSAHICFRAKTRAAVRAFHDAGLCFNGCKHLLP